MKIKHRSQLPDLLRFYELPLVAAELGCAEAYFSNDLLEGGITKLFMVDNWGTIKDLKGDGGFPQEWHDRNFNDAMERVKKHDKKFEVLRGLTTDMAHHVADYTLSLLYLDASHDYNSVSADLNAWFDKVRMGGIIAGHDYLNKGFQVFEAVNDFCKDKYEVFTIPENKNEDAGFWFRKL